MTYYNCRYILCKRSAGGLDRASIKTQKLKKLLQNLFDYETEDDIIPWAPVTAHAATCGTNSRLYLLADTRFRGFASIILCVLLQCIQSGYSYILLNRARAKKGQGDSKRGTHSRTALKMVLTKNGFSPPVTLARWPACPRRLRTQPLRDSWRPPMAYSGVYPGSRTFCPALS